MTDLAGSCAALRDLIGEARQLIHQPDEDGTATRGQPGSRPPWNQAAANAYTDPYEGIPRLAASMHRDAHGDLGPRLPLGRAITAIASYETAVLVNDAARAAAILSRWIRQIEELPAIDLSEPARRLQGVACPYCERAMLAVRARSGEIACMNGYRGACKDWNGNPPRGRIEPGRIDPQNGQTVWNDGRVT